MNLGNLLREQPPPTRLIAELNKIFEIVESGNHIFQGWLSIDCYDKNIDHRMTILYRWDTWWHYNLIWTGKKAP